MFLYSIPILIYVFSFFFDEKFRGVITKIIILYLFIILSLRGDTGADYITYQERFNEESSINLIDAYDSFSIISFVLKNLNLDSFRLVLVIFAFFSSYGLYIFFKYVNTKYAIIILLYYYSYLFFVQPFNAIRAGVAALFFLLSIIHFIKKNKLKTISYFILSCLFHPTALIGIFCYFPILKRRFAIINIIIFFITVIVFDKLLISNFLNYINAASLGVFSIKANAYTENISNNIGNRTAPVYFVVITFKLFYNLVLRYFIYKIKNINESYLYILNVQLFAMFIYYFLFSLPVVALRFYELVGVVEIIIFVYPLFIFNEKNLVKFLLSFIILAQFIITTQLIGGTIVQKYIFYF
jgi:hypothetical protein